MKTPKEQILDELETTCEGVKAEGESLLSNYWVNLAVDKCYRAGITRDQVSNILNLYK